MKFATITFIGHFSLFFLILFLQLHYLVFLERLYNKWITLIITDILALMILQLESIQIKMSLKNKRVTYLIIMDFKDK